MLEDLSKNGYANVGRILSDDACRELIAMYSDGARFRSHVVMERHNFGVGDYKYFANPMPQAIAELREQWYPRLAVVANEWMSALKSSTRYPEALDEFRDRCARAGQTRPTPLLLHYAEG